MKTVNQSYTPFGHEWKSAVKIMPKEHIINLFAEACIERDERIKALESLLNDCAADFGHLASMFKLENDNAMKNACLKTQAKINQTVTQ